MSIATEEQAVVEAVPKDLFVDGEWRPASGGGTFAVEDPATGETLCEIGGEYKVAGNAQSRVLVMRQPVGPSFFITPWNFPTAMGTRKVGPAIAAGCTMVWKPAQLTPLSALALTELLTDAGLPPGVLNIITSSSSGSVAAPVISGPRLRKLSFTGSTEVGRKLIERSAR